MLLLGTVYLRVLSGSTTKVYSLMAHKDRKGKKEKMICIPFLSEKAEAAQLAP